MSIGKRRYMKKQSNAPQIRFQNFEAEWLDSTIGRHISLLNGRAYKQEELLDEGKYKVLRVGNFNTNSKWYYSNLELEENKYVNKGDLLYLWATNFGPEIWTGEKAIYHYHIWKLEFDRTEINQDYLNIWLESDKNKIQQNTNGSTMVHITKTMMEERGISLPNFDEQSAIGFFFRTLDDLLVSYKENLTNCQSLKATMLSKMFPKAGQKVPEIRLDGFEGEWECLKIAEIFQIIDGDRGKSYPGESDFYSVGHTLFLDTGNVKKSGLDFSTTKFISEEKDKELRNGKLILGDFILTSRGTLGNVAYYNENIQKRYSSVRINSAMLILRPLLGDKISPDYILAVLRGNLISDFMKVNQVGSAQPHITKKEFSKIKVLVPSNIQEQQAIGSYFSNLDNLIVAHQDKISQLETLKKKLLQDMFV